jgi:hypothetical protein
MHCFSIAAMAYMKTMMNAGGANTSDDMEEADEDDDIDIEGMEDEEEQSAFQIPVWIYYNDPDRRIEVLVRKIGIPKMTFNITNDGNTFMVLATATCDEPDQVHAMASLLGNSSQAFLEKFSPIQKTVITEVQLSKRVHHSCTVLYGKIPGQKFWLLTYRYLDTVEHRTGYEACEVDQQASQQV